MDEKVKKFKICAAIAIAEVTNDRVRGDPEGVSCEESKRRDFNESSSCSRGLRKDDDVIAQDKSRESDLVESDSPDIDFDDNDAALFALSTVELLGTISLLSTDTDPSFGKIVPDQRVFATTDLNGRPLRLVRIVLAFVQHQIVSLAESEQSSASSQSQGDVADPDLFPRLQFGLSVVDEFHRVCEGRPRSDVAAKAAAARTNSFLKKCLDQLFDKAFAEAIGPDKRVDANDADSPPNSQESTVGPHLNLLKYIFKLAINRRFKVRVTDMIAAFVLRHHEQLLNIDEDKTNLVNFLENILQLGFELAKSLTSELFTTKATNTTNQPDLRSYISTGQIVFQPMCFDKMRHPEKMALKSDLKQILEDLMASTVDLTLLMPIFCSRIFEMYSVLHDIAVKLDGKKRPSK